MLRCANQKRFQIEHTLIYYIQIFLNINAHYLNGLYRYPKNKRGICLNIEQGAQPN